MYYPLPEPIPILAESGVTYTDIAKITTRINALENFQEQTLPILFIVSVLAGFACGFLYAKFYHKEQPKTSFGKK